MTELPDRLLRDALRDTASTTPSSTCIDADGLAAWADGMMTAANRAAFESHVASCARCHALVAAMVQIEPPAIEPAWWRRATFAWLLPLATATAALVIVVGLAVRRPQVSPSVVSVVSSTQEASGRPSPAAPEAVPPAASAAAPPAVSDRGGATRTRPRPLPSPSAAAVEAPPDSELRAAKPTQPPAPATARAKAADAESSAASSPAASASEAKAVPIPPPAPAAPPPALASSSSAFRDDAARRESAGAAPSQPLTMMKGIATALVEVASPDRNSKWRILGSRVEHTSDGGVTWQPQALGITTPVHAGSAPTARICWLAGAGGVVLRTIDGATWTRIAFPEPVDLVAIQATDALHATVIAAAGSRFSTSDGGATWNRE